MNIGRGRKVDDLVGLVHGADGLMLVCWVCPDVLAAWSPGAFPSITDILEAVDPHIEVHHRRGFASGEGNPHA